MISHLRHRKILIIKAIKLLPSATLKGVDKDELNEELAEFFKDRIKYQLKATGMEINVISSVLNRAEGLNILEIKTKAEILAKFASSSDGSAAIEAYKRAGNILSIEEKKGQKQYAPKPSKSNFETVWEETLFEALENARNNIKNGLKKNDFANPLGNLITLSKPVGEFFDNTQINSDNPKVRENRLKLSALIVSVFEMIADFSAI